MSKKTILMQLIQATSR